MVLRRDLPIILAATLIARPCPADEPPHRNVADALAVQENPCFDRASLAAAVEAWLKRPSIDPRLTIEVDAPDAAHGSVSFRLRRDGRVVGERRLPAIVESCASLAAMVSLTVALAMDATLFDELRPPEVPAPATHDAPATPAPEPEPVQAQRPGLDVDLEGMMLVGLLPRPVAGARLGVEVPLARWVGFRVDATATAASLVPVGSGTAAATLLAAGAGPCLSPFAPRPLLRTCAGVRFGELTAAGVGYPTSETARVPWSAATFQIDSSVPLAPRTYLRVSFDAFAAFSRPKLVQESGAGAVEAARALPAAGFGLGAGPALTF
jgi:hypothetical protein